MAVDLGKKRKHAGDAPTVSPSKQSKSKPRDAASSLGETSAAGKSRQQEGSTATLKVSRDDPFRVGPLLVNAADFVPAKDATFTLYSNPSASHKKKRRKSDSVPDPTLEDNFILAGETDSIEYVGGNWSAHATVGTDEALRTESRGYSGDYMVGIYDPATSMVTLRAAPLFTLTRTIKSLNSLSIDAQSQASDWTARKLARRGLGEAFGNRKTKTKARNEDRMKVDTTNMKSVIDTMRSDIEDNTKDMAGLDSIKEEADRLRPIPPPYFEAMHPADVYPIQSTLIPLNVWNALNVRHLYTSKTPQDLAKKLGRITGPLSTESWLVSRLWDLCGPLRHKEESSYEEGPSKKITFDEDGQLPQEKSGGGILKASGDTKVDIRSKLKACYYAGLLWVFWKQARNLGDRSMLIDRLHLKNNPAADLIVDDLRARFAETPRGQTKPVLSTFHETKLLAYSFALCLHVEDFAVEPSALSKEIGLGASRLVEIFKSLGCSTNTRSVVDSTGTSTRSERRLILKTPLTLPKPRQGAAKKSGR